uniref:Uncharacterized protein n=1 Tax=Cyanistes caeruleus TaxID=156563 RepID=A0A8C0U9C4_CYACU
MPCPCPVYPLSIPCPSPVRALSIPCPSPVHALSMPCPSPVHALSIPCPCPVHPLSIPCPCPVHPPSIPCPCPVPWPLAPGRLSVSPRVPVPGDVPSEGHPVSVLPVSCPTGGFLCLTTRSNPSNLRYKAELEAALGQLERSGAWQKLALGVPLCLSWLPASSPCLSFLLQGMPGAPFLATADPRGKMGMFQVLEQGTAPPGRVTILPVPRCSKRAQAALVAPGCL